MKFLFLSALITLSACSSHNNRSPDSLQIPVETLARLKKLYPDQSESFIIERFLNADSALMKWRSFPPYYYEMVDRLKSQFPQQKNFFAQSGLCAGDAHLENFGFLYRPDKKDAIFSINDLDDVSTCPLFSDALRLLVGHKIVSPSLSTEEWLTAYKDGIAGKRYVVPGALDELQADSLKKKTEPSKKYRKMFEAKKCDGEFATMNAKEKKTLDSYLIGQGLKYSYACMRTKDSGGSAGLSRFVVEAFDGADTKLTFELKPLAKPSPLYNQSGTNRLDSLKDGINKFWGEDFARYYYPVILDGVSYLRRPVWGGNAGVAADELTSSGLIEVSIFEAHKLGTLHAKSRGDFSALKSSDLEKIRVVIEETWKKEMNE